MWRKNGKGIISFIAAFVLAISTLAALPVAPAGATVTTSTTTIPVVPMTLNSGALTAVSCVSAGNCTGVGSDGNTLQLFYEVETAGVWGTSTDLPPTISSRPSISCYSLNNCVAVARDRTDNAFFLVESNGVWSTENLLPAGNIGSGQLTAVQCPSQTFCVAVGQDSNSMPMYVTIDPQTSAVITQYATSTGTVPGIDVPSEFTGVSCVDNADCMIVGSSNTGYGIYLAESAGIFDASPTTESNFSGTFTSVSCVSTYLCVAAGESSLKPAIDIDLGGTWSGNEQYPVSGSQQQDTFNAVSCPSDQLCEMVGDVTPNNNGDGIVASIDPSTNSSQMFTTESLPGGFIHLNGVDCPSTTSCTAVGIDDIGGNPIWESFNGSWGPVQRLLAPNFPQPGYGAASSISCWSSLNCVQVGYVNNNSNPYVSIETNGTWSAMNVFSTGNDVFLSVSCTSATFCVAVGSDSVTNDFDIISGDPSTWVQSDITMVPMMYANSLLTSVSCVSQTQCTVVGFDGGTIALLNGDPSQWTQGSLQYIMSTDLFLSLYSVSCISATQCTAVGDDNQSGTPQAIVLNGNPSHWNAASVVDMNMTESTGAHPTVSCVNNSGTAWCGFETTDATSSSGTITLSGDPSSWNGSTSGNDLTQLSALDTISCGAVGNCVGAGYDYQSGFPLTIVGDPNTWQSTDAIFVPNFTDYANLDAVAMFGTSFQAVGQDYQANSPLVVSQIVTGVSVTYSAGAGSGTVPVQTPVSSSFVVASASGLTDPGYRFSGWSDGANTYQPGDTYTVGSSPVTLTALWTPLITYSAPSPASNVQATLNGNIATVTFVPGSNGNLPTSYAIEMFVNGVLQGNVCTMAIVQSCTVSGITPNAVVTFVVVSSNDIGSATSNSSNALTYSVATTTTTTTTTTTMTTTTTVPKAPTTTGTSTQLAVVVEFPNGVSNLTVAIKKQLTKVARQITSAGVRAVWVKGYADATGPQALNQMLSLDRATNVKNFLASLCSSSVQFHVIAGGTKPGVGASYRIVEVTSK